jgi:ferric-dicitrate binding protein FerR (iron transport regulator)
MGRWRRSNPCERATQWISLRLDGELSELEEAALVRHLEGCPRCQGLASRVESFTALLRRQPPLELAHPVVVTAPRSQRRRVARRGAVVLAFAATVGAVAGIVILPHGATPETSALSFSSIAQQKRFARFEHVRAEPETFVAAATAPAVPSFAARALG